MPSDLPSEQHINGGDIMLSHDNKDDQQTEEQFPAQQSSVRSSTPDENDIPPITSVKVFVEQFWVESKKLWYLSAPAIFTILCQYSLGAITQTFAGHIGTLELSAVSVENSVIGGFSFGVMFGMGSALETLCGQAFGAGQINMLGVYMQRSWIILIVTSFFLTFFYIFSAPILRLIGQKHDISEAAGQLAIWMIPQLYAYAMNFPIAKFLQAQSKIMAMAWISSVVLALHTLFSWLFMLKLKWGLAGAAVVLNGSWWLIVGAQLVYIFMGSCGEAWSGFSWKAFQNLWGFVRLSLESAVMLCLETWYFMSLVLWAGYLNDAKVSVAALSVCTNIVGWTAMVAFGFNTAVSVRVSNELGASHPRTAKFSVVVVVVSSFAMGIIFAMILLIFNKQYPALFADGPPVKRLVTHLTPLLAFCIIINAIQPALSGVVIGAGWQGIVAKVNIACYYIFGLPLGLVMGYKLKWGVQGIWGGMTMGTILQTIILFYLVYRTNWKKEASVATERVKKWGGHVVDKEDVELTRNPQLGMGSALETLCGQAFGAGQIDMLGVYMQSSWIILTVTAFFLMFFYIFAAPLLRLIGQTPDISQAAGELAIWMIPQLYAYGLNFSIAKFLQSQSKMMAMAWISGIVLALHALFSWLLMLKWGWGMVRGAVVLNASWWLIVVAQLVYIFMGSCGRAWSGFSWRAFVNLWSFVRLSLESAVMLW